MSIRDRVNYVDAQDGSLFDPSALGELFSVQFSGEAPEGHEGTVNIINKSDLSKRKFRSCYMRWALTVNSLNISQKYYGDHPDRGIGVGFLRENGDSFDMKTLVEFDSNQSIDATKRCLEVISAYGVFDLYGCFEEILFDLYECHLRDKPQKLMQGSEYKALRVLYRNRCNDEMSMDKWETALNNRIDDWKRKKVYTKMADLFISFIKDSGIDKAKIFSPDAMEGMRRGIGIISELRNIITHGGSVVTKNLGELCGEGKNPFFLFRSGDSISVDLHHLAAVEFFFDTIISDINMSAMEIMTLK